MEMADIVSRDMRYILVTDSAPNYVCAFKDTGTRISCIAHSINLAVKGLFAVISKQICGDSKFYHKILHECKRFATWANHSKSDELEFTIKNICETRWNTHLIMFESISKQFDSVVHAAEKIPLLNISFKNDQLIQIINFLKPFETATVQMSSSQDPTLNPVVSWLHQLIKHCKNDALDARFVTYLKEQMMETMKKNSFLS